MISLPILAGSRETFFGGSFFTELTAGDPGVKKNL